MLQVNQQVPSQAQPTQQAPQVNQIPEPVKSPQYSNETQMQNHAPAGVITVNVNLDAEAYKILQEASLIHSESIVNFGIKLFAKTNAYKEFMLKNEYKSLDISTEDLSGAVNVTDAVDQVDNTPAPSTDNTSSTPAAPKSAAGFAAW